MALAAVAHAQTADELARARTHFEAGRALYNLANYTDALREFSAGYQLVPKPQFLINLGQCYRKLDDLPRAREMYQKFLVEAPANDPDRGPVEQILAEIERELAARPAPPPPETAPAPAPTPAPVLVTGQPKVEKKRPFIARHWWIIPVSAVVVTGIVVGITLGTRPTNRVDCSAATLGCIDTTVP